MWFLHFHELHFVRIFLFQNCKYISICKYLTCSFDLVFDLIQGSFSQQLIRHYDEQWANTASKQIFTSSNRMYQYIMLDQTPQNQHIIQVSMYRYRILLNFPSTPVMGWSADVINFGMASIYNHRLSSFLDIRRPLYFLELVSLRL